MSTFIMSEELHDEAVRLAKAQLTQVCLLTHDHLDACRKDPDPVFLEKQAEVFVQATNFLKYSVKEIRP
jgi:hypothetical protein